MASRPVWTAPCQSRAPVGVGSGAAGRLGRAGGDPGGLWGLPSCSQFWLALSWCLWLSQACSWLHLQPPCGVLPAHCLPTHTGVREVTLDPTPRWPSQVPSGQHPQACALGISWPSVGVTQAGPVGDTFRREEGPSSGDPGPAASAGVSYSAVAASGGGWWPCSGTRPPRTLHRCGGLWGQWQSGCRPPLLQQPSPSREPCRPGVSPAPSRAPPQASSSSGQSVARSMARRARRPPTPTPPAARRPPPYMGWALPCRHGPAPPTRRRGHTAAKQDLGPVISIGLPWKILLQPAALARPWAGGRPHPWGG